LLPVQLVLLLVREHLSILHLFSLFVKILIWLRFLLDIALAHHIHNFLVSIFFTLSVL